ncbi:ABC transporter substrate-binding protein [Bradyrhizobium sp. Arg816]|uniref:ABC transporter substrate-binding protein n=1 Tax=Bradyrhizobium sp. Arg816 TaxID=2998491 RepID=UPI00249F5963|nr:ABC transporter substrate-binding protein [Bradyrhizobium sp. Arg816]MDI3564836.1 ABC transporter substrate-binding protein [Bradyrhizobium sp. Arg816]
MRRREFMTLLSGAAMSSSVARAQQPGRQYRVAILATAGPQTLLDELGQAGFVEGHNLEIDSRAIGVAPASYAKVAVELTKALPDVLVVFGPDAARAAQNATQRVPIVALADDLLGSKLVASMPHPEGNTTGVAIFAFQLDVKRLELLHEALPGARRIALFADHEPIRNFEALESAAHAFGIEVVPFSARSETEAIRAIDAMKATPVDAVNVLASPILGGALRFLIRDRFALHALPAILQWPEEAEAGGLIAYGPRLSVVFRQCARQVAKLLRGARVVDVPVEQPTEFELIINLKSAKALGVQISPALLARANATIE